MRISKWICLPGRVGILPAIRRILRRTLGVAGATLADDLPPLLRPANRLQRLCRNETLPDKASLNPLPFL